MSTRGHDRTLTPAGVIAVHDVTPHMRRISVVAPEFRNLGPIKPAQWMKVIFPSADNGKPAARGYTIRAYDPVIGRIDLDFALHGGTGPAASWVRHAQVGEIIQLAGPGPGYDIDPRVDNHILIGDMTALPAIAAVAAALPATTRAAIIVEVIDARDEQPLDSTATLDVHWLHSGAEAPGTTGQIELAVQGAGLDYRKSQILLAGEAFMVRSVLTHLLVDRGVPQTSIQSKGYWKKGTPAYRGDD